jgi:hypothetical protein
MFYILYTFFFFPESLNYVVFLRLHDFVCSVTFGICNALSLTNLTNCNSINHYVFTYKHDTVQKIIRGRWHFSIPFREIDCFVIPLAVHLVLVVFKYGYEP